MVKFGEVTGKKLEDVVGGAYDRCFANAQLGLLLSRVQSLIIKNGYELEGIVKDFASDYLIEDLDIFLDSQIIRQGIHVAEKSTIRKSKKIEGHGIEPDFLVFIHEGTNQSCYIIELKDGHEFDTKSSAKEHANLHSFLSRNAMALQYFQSYCKIVGFNATSKEEIHKGFKSKIAIDQAMTGREFCEMLKLDYAEINREREVDRKDNFDQFINDLLSIESVRNAVIEKLEG